MSFRFALISDVHYGQPTAHDGRLRKLSALSGALVKRFALEMRHVRPDLVINLGDVVEDCDERADLANYSEFISDLQCLEAPLLHVAGNHDSVHLGDAALADLWGRRPPLYYSHDAGPLRFVILRTVETRDVRVQLPDVQIQWLEGELERSRLPVIVLMHHPASDMDLRGNRWFEKAPHLCRLANRRVVRQVLEQSGKVIAVFNGHAHWNHLDVVRGLPYVTLQSLIENLDEDAPGRAAASWAVAEVRQRELMVHIHGLEPARYQFGF